MLFYWFRRLFGSGCISWILSGDQIVRYSSITKENFLDVLIKPGSIIYILLLIVLLMVFMLLNLTMYIVLFDASLRHSRHGLIEYLVQVEKHFFRFFGKRKIVRIFYMLPFAFAVYMPPFLMALNNNTVTKYLLKLCIRGTGRKHFGSDLQ